MVYCQPDINSVTGRPMKQLLTLAIALLAASCASAQALVPAGTFLPAKVVERDPHVVKAVLTHVDGLKPPFDVVPAPLAGCTVAGIVSPGPENFEAVHWIEARCPGGRVITLDGAAVGTDNRVGVHALKVGDPVKVLFLGSATL